MVLTNQVAPRGRIDHVGIGGADLPLDKHVLMVDPGRGAGGRAEIRRRRAGPFALIGIERMESAAGRVAETGAECESEQSPLVVTGLKRDGALDAADVQQGRGL